MVRDPRRRGHRRLRHARGRGYGTEVVAGLSRWLLAQDGVRRVVARRVAADNTPSRRALERAGFVLESADEEYTWYALAG